MSTFVTSPETVVEGDNLSAVLDEVLQLILCTVNRVTKIESVVSQWAPIFALKSTRYFFCCLSVLYFSTFFFFLDIDHAYFQFADFFAGAPTEG